MADIPSRVDHIVHCISCGEEKIPTSNRQNSNGRKGQRYAQVGVGGRKNPQGASRIEHFQGNPACFFVLFDQQAGDQKTGDHKEHAHPQMGEISNGSAPALEEEAASPLEMADQYEQDRNRPKPVQRRYMA